MNKNHIKRKNKKVICIMTMMSFFLFGCAPKNVEEVSFSQVYETLDYASETEIVEADIIQETNESTDAEKTDSQTEPVEIIMVGDVLLHTRVSDSGKMDDGRYQYDHLFANVKEKVEAADLALVNQEVILGGTELGLSGYPAFNGAFEVGDSLVNTGFDVILHATNHALDKGKKGLFRCVFFWRNQYPEIGVVGIYDNETDANSIYVKEVKGIRIAILNYTYGTNGIALPSDAPYAVNIWNDQKVAMDVAKAKELADFVIVCPHWGTEYVLTQTKSQEKQAQYLADLGVDLIIGTHPHVVEPVVWIEGIKGNKTLCYYSIGNFINATSGTGKGTADRMLGAMADVMIQKEEDQVSIVSYEVNPLISHLVEGKGLMTTYFIEDYTEELSNANEIKKQDASFSLDYCKELCRQVFGELYHE